MNRLKKLALAKGAALCAISLLSTGAAFAQHACFSVHQNGEELLDLGEAWYPLINGEKLTIDFADGKVNVSGNNGVLATLPCTEGGQLAMEFSTKSGSGIRSHTYRVTERGYATLYSPFQLTVNVPDNEAEVEVYAPSYVDGKLMLTDETRMKDGTVIPPCTGLILKNNGAIELDLSNGTSSSVSSALSGSALKIPVSSVSGQTIYTLGYAKDDTSLYGFFKYIGTTLAAGKAYFAEAQSGSNVLSFLPFGFAGDVTGIATATTAPASLRNGKYIDNGQVVIVKNGQKYNVSGNRIH